MPQLPGLLPTAFTIFAYVVCIKLAARLYRRTQLSWKHAAVFGVVLFLVLLAVGTCVRALNLISEPVSAALLDIATGLLAQLAVGAWFLGPRARTATGAPVGFKGGALLALITYALVFFLSTAAALLLPLLARMAGISA
ncbi:hypothetical protein SAMN05216350_102323 [Polaromonas sp. YR568]|uniref:hypothetical protein n=1 Tax=Polaromonas sp. YR568 TaxID=1855301 RepID=UPI0008DEEEDB|nr:hypothetical protein [Polaromonas sp. YR568]SFU51783.1 hypothetical protein SAMN05216350_102323 [Polaromonas sp. YR568]